MGQTNRHKGKPRFALRINPFGATLPSEIRQLLAWFKTKLLQFNRLPIRWRILAIVGVLVLAELYQIVLPYFQEHSYALGTNAALLPESSAVMAKRISFDAKQQSFNLSTENQPSAETLGHELTAPSVLHKDASKGVSVSDPKNNVTFEMTPLYGLADGQRQQDRIVYPLLDGSGWAVYTLRGIGVKEDILLTHAPGDTMTYNYRLKLGDTLRAKIEKDGSLGIYGNTLFSGNVAAGTDKDAALLQKARKNAPKNTLLFVIPKPVIMGKQGEVSGVSGSYRLSGDELSMTVSGLTKATYPISIDPSIYVVTASQFMHGNNETNINFDVANKLIKKGRTTGARFNAWNATTGLVTGVFGGSTVAAGGFIYNIGGGTFTGQVFTSQGAGTFTVPSGVTSITVKAWGAGGGGSGGSSGAVGAPGGGGGYMTGTFAVTPGDVLNVYVGGAGNGGSYNGGGNTAGGGGSGGGYSSVIDQTQGNKLLAVAAGGAGGGGSRQNTSGGAGGAGGCTSTGTSCAGTNGGSSNTGGGGGTTSAGGAGGTGGTNGTAGTSLTGGKGGDGTTGTSTGSGVLGGLATGGAGGLANIQNTRAGGGGGGAGYFGGGGGAASASTGNSSAAGGGGGSNFANAGGTSVLHSAGSGTTPGNVNDVDRNGAGNGGGAGSTAGNGSTGTNGIVIITAGGSTKASKGVSWSKLDTGNGTITSADPGSGNCSGWCSTSDYNLPSGRANFSLVAYNGFLYALGGTDADGGSCNTTFGTGSSGVCNTVYISKLGANGEPQLWHPTDTNKSNWVYWYRDTNLSSERAYAGAVAYNNRMYLVGGLTKPSGTSTPVSTVEYANIKPDGRLGAWTTTASLGSAVWGNSVQVYNDYLYSIGGASTVGGAPTTTTYYSKIDGTGTLNTWKTNPNSFSSGRMALGGSFSVIWGGYLYVSSGCGATNANGYCTSVLSDTQVASINADGSLDIWNTVGNVSDSRMGHSLIAWRDNIYEIAGCSAQNASTGICDSLISTIYYGKVNQDGDASTVGNSSPNGTAPCSGTTPTGCDLPGSTNVGNMLQSSVIYNGYLYVIGGCSSNNCNSQSGNVAYTAITSGGIMSKPATCPSGAYQGGMWCVDNINGIAGGLAASSPLVFNGRIYLVGGSSGGSFSLTGNIYYTTVNADGSIGAWSTTSLSAIGATSVAYTYAYARANPSSAGTNPGNLYIFGGCTGTNSNISCSTYSGSVYKCNIGTSGAPNGCTTTNQLQIGTYPGDTAAGLGVMSGAVYANYVYLVGGSTPSSPDLSSVIYAKIDNNNNIVSAGSGWVKSTNTMSVARQRSSAFGYNGYLYAVGGYNSGGNSTLADIQFIKINTSDGSLGSATEGWNTSAVTINQRWGLSVPVSNSYAYVIGGCINGSSPSCTGRTDTIQTFQVYNNGSGGTTGFSSGNNIGADRIGGSMAIMNGYIYYAGGCSTINCSAVTNTTYYAPIDAYGNIGTWSSGGALPAARAFGKLVAAGGTLYYVGGQTGAAATTATGTVYYTSGFSSGNPTWSGSAATKGIGDGGGGAQARTQLGAAAWNNRLYVLGGYDSAGAVQPTVYTSPQLNAGGDITGNWSTGTSFNVARAGLSAVAYANNLYVLGGSDGTNYLGDTQFAQINSASGAVGGWSYSESLPVPIQQGDAFAANGYIYFVGGRTAASTCTPNVFVAPISANTTVATGNNPTGVGKWYRANNLYAGDRYGNGAAYYGGKLYVLGGGCSAFVGATDRTYVSALRTQAQVAKYSIMFDNDSDVFPTKWLLNGVDNSIGAKWQLKYRSMTNPGAVAQCAPSPMSDWGQETNFGDVTLGLPGIYLPKDGSGTNTNCARYYYFNVTVDSQAAFGYPDDVSRGPTITDLTLQFTADPAKRLMHGRTFTGGLQQPIDTPF